MVEVPAFSQVLVDLFGCYCFWQILVEKLMASTDAYFQIDLIFNFIFPNLVGRGNLAVALHLLSNDATNNFLLGILIEIVEQVGNLAPFDDLIVLGTIASVFFLHFFLLRLLLLHVQLLLLYGKKQHAAE